MNLDKEYTEETNKSPFDSISGFSCYSDFYVDWLKDKIRELTDS